MVGRIADDGAGFARGRDLPCRTVLAPDRDLDGQTKGQRIVRVERSSENRARRVIVAIRHSCDRVLHVEMQMLNGIVGGVIQEDESSAVFCKFAKIGCGFGAEATGVLLCGMVPARYPTVICDTG